MGSSSWFHGSVAAGGGSCRAAELHFREEKQQQELISSQIQHHLNQISMDMNVDDELALYLTASGCDGGGGGGAALDDMLDNLFPSHPAGGGYFTSPSPSSSLLSGGASLSCSPESSAQFLPAASGAVASGHHQEVSSHAPSAPVATYNQVNQQCMSFHDAAATPPPPAKTPTSAFKRYARHLGPRRPPKPGACGQRMFKTAMLVLTKMHMATRHNSHNQYYYQEAAPPPAATAGNQLQHMISERKRREKLNDSFHALKKVLPPGSKKDKTSILITARDYVNSLKSKVRELEEKNKELQSQLDRRAIAGAGEDEAETSNKVEIEVTRVAATEDDPQELCTVKVEVRSPCGNMAEVAVRTLQCMKDLAGDDVSLVAMSSGVGAAGEPPRANLMLQLKSTSPSVKWDEESVKQAVAKVVADVLPPPSTAARRSGAGVKPTVAGAK